MHRDLGPGLLESTYEACPVSLLLGRGLRVEQQVAMPVVSRGKTLEVGYRLDLLVERRVVVELKTVAKLEPVHYAQLATYLKHSGCDVGLLINFNVVRLIDGLHRLIRDYHSPRSLSSMSSAIDSVEG